MILQDGLMKYLDILVTEAKQVSMIPAEFCLP